MARFLTFETTALKLNNSVFPCNSISVSLNANTTPVFDINGNLLYYSPTAPIQGKFSTNFYLTGALPSFLKLENQTEAPVRLSFNQFYIPSAYLTDLSFSVEPFQPISVATSFVFYHGLTVLNTDLNDNHTSFSDSLKTLNGLSSYIVTTDRDTNAENPKDFIITNFDYSFSVERSPVLRIKESIPSRVALKQINAQFGIAANNLDGRLKVQGNNAIFNAILRDNTSLSTSTNFSLTGIIVDQSYSVSEGSYGLSNIKMIQNINPKRNIISIPFEIEDYDIQIPESIIDDPNAKPFISDDGKVNNGGTKPPSLAVGNDLDLQAFYVITSVYLYYAGIFTEGINAENNCELNKSVFNFVQFIGPGSAVIFEPATLPVHLAVGNNPSPTIAGPNGAPYYYIGRFKINKQFLKDGGSTGDQWNNFEGNLEVIKRNSVNNSQESMGNTFSFIATMENYVDFQKNSADCQKAVIQPSFFYGRLWSAFKGLIIPGDSSVLDLKEDTFLNPIVFDEGDG
jgi:hypothetical protein